MKAKQKTKTRIKQALNDLGTSEKDDMGYDIKKKLIKMQIV